MAALLAIALVFLLVLVSLPFIFQGKRPIDGPPGPRPLPLVGNLFHLLLLLRRHRTLHASLASITSVHGELALLRLGRRHFAVASSRAAASEVLRTHDKLLSARYLPEALQVPSFANHSLSFALTCDDNWRSLRSLWATRLLSPRALEAGERAREAKAAEMVEFLRAREGTEVAVAEVAFATVMNTVGQMVFSRDVTRLGEEEDGWGRSFKKGMYRVMEVARLPNLADYYPGLLRGCDIQGLRRKVDMYMSECYEMWKLVISERKEEMGRGQRGEDDFLAAMLEAGIDGQRLITILQEVFIGATDTVTNTIEWAMAELVRTPAAMARLTCELRAALGDGGLRESDLPRLPYLQACIKETLRIHPPAPVLLHYSSDPCRLLGYSVPGDCAVAVNVWAVGRDPASWEEPLAFVPERFLDSGEDAVELATLPFGWGRRACVGMSLANRVVPLVVASMAHNFEWSLPGGMDVVELSMEESDGVIIKREKPLVLVPARAL